MRSTLTVLFPALLGVASGYAVLFGLLVFNRVVL
jgi:hypothetical protein